jgi:hypothetical protein
VGIFPVSKPLLLLFRCLSSSSSSSWVPRWCICCSHLLYQPWPFCPPVLYSQHPGRHLHWVPCRPSPVDWFYHLFIKGPSFSFLFLFSKSLKFPDTLTGKLGISWDFSWPLVSTLKQL